MVGLTQRIRSVHHIAPTSVIGIAHGDRKLDLPNRERTRRTTFQMTRGSGRKEPKSGRVAFLSESALNDPSTQP